MIKINNKAVLYIICSIVCGVIVSGIINNNVFAEDVNYEVNIASGINITIPSDTVTLNLNPFVTAFGSTDLPVTVKTNNPTGYTLTMSPSDDTTTSLTRTGGTETIPTLADLSGGYTEQTFTTNKWGYKLSSTNYLPFATSNEIAVTNAPTAASGNTSTVTFAAKGDTTLTAGTYSLEITFAAVTNYVPHIIADGGDMQDISSLTEGGCPSTLTTGQAYTLTDSRDGESYKVARLADGNCWLLDNLRLDLTDSTILNTLSSANTNIDSATEIATLTSLKSGNRSAGDQYATAGVSNWTSSQSYSSPLVATSGNCYNTNCVNDPESGKWNKDAVVANSVGSGSNKVGAYYNYCAASAGSYCYDSGAGTGNASQDICPAGWRMPTGDSSGEYQALFTTYNSIQTATDTGSLQYNLSTPLSGYFSNGSAYNQGTGGSFWSSTRYDGSVIYHLYVDSSNVYPQGRSTRNGGESVRCLLQ